MKKLLFLLILLPNVAYAGFFEPKAVCKPVTVCGGGSCQTYTVCN